MSSSDYVNHKYVLTKYIDYTYYCLKQEVIECALFKCEIYWFKMRIHAYNCSQIYWFNLLIKYVLIKSFSVYIFKFSQEFFCVYILKVSLCL